MTYTPSGFFGSPEELKYLEYLANFPLTQLEEVVEKTIAEMVQLHNNCDVAYLSNMKEIVMENLKINQEFLRKIYLP